MRHEAITRVVSAYDDLLTRAYSRARFVILRQRFLDEIGQYLPAEGDVLDIGCGFGLFSLYYAQLFPRARFQGIDVDARRIAQAERAAARLGLRNVVYAVGDARQYRAAGPFRAAYMLDIVHHVPPETVASLLGELWKGLVPGGRLIIKDVDARPAPKRWFTWALDRLVAPGTPVHYWPADQLQGLLEEVGFRVYRHLMVDVLPYPHVLYVCEKAGR